MTRPFQNSLRYQPARGRFAPRDAYEDAAAVGAVVIDIAGTKPGWSELWSVIEREMKIRFYRPRSIKNYKIALRQLVKWFKRPADELSPEHIRAYLGMLVDRGVGASWLSINITAIRTCLDKMGGMSLAGSLWTPRKPRTTPIVLSESEVTRLLAAAPSLRDKLLLGLMYACGMRVSETCRLRWRDIDPDRKAIRVVRGKGANDRYVLLPQVLTPILVKGLETCAPAAFLFPGDRPGTHFTPRAAQNAMKRALRLAAIKKDASCHSLRHSFATHMIEHGTDIRFLQELLGHLRLDTTRLYTHVSDIVRAKLTSPLDRIAMPELAMPVERYPNLAVEIEAKLRIRLDILRRNSSGHWETTAAIAIETPGMQPERPDRPDRVELLTAKVIEPLDGWIIIDLPPAEQWLGRIAGLPQSLKTRLSSIEFYDRLRQAITIRFLARKAEAVARPQPIIDRSG